jgi:hypothetical protein
MCKYPRMAAEAKAYTMERLDPSAHYVAAENCDGSWRVDKLPLHAHKAPFREGLRYG